MAHQLLQNLKNETEPQRTEQRKAERAKMDSKGGSWQQSGGLLQPPWLCRSKASPFWPTISSKYALQIPRFTESETLPCKSTSPLQLKPASLGFQLVKRELAWLCRSKASPFEGFSSDVINRRLTEVSIKIGASLSLLEIQPCTLKTEHCDYDAIMRRQQ